MKPDEIIPGRTYEIRRLGAGSFYAKVISVDAREREAIIQWETLLNGEWLQQSGRVNATMIIRLRSGEAIQ